MGKLKDMLSGQRTYKIGMVLEPKGNESVLTIIGLGHPSYIEPHYKCLNNDDKSIRLYGENRLERYYDFKGKYNKMIMVLYAKA